MNLQKPLEVVVKNAANGIKVAGTAASVVAAISQCAKPMADFLSGLVEEYKRLSTMPELYSKDYSLTVEQAKNVLKQCGLNATFIEAQKPLPKYRNCVDMQVVWSNPRAKRKIEAGRSIIVQYVTKNIIDQSQKMYEEELARKERLVIEKTERRAVQKETAKKVASKAANIAKSGIEKIPVIVYKRNGNTEEIDE